MSLIIQLDNWIIYASADEYVAPEARLLRVTGVGRGDDSEPLTRFWTSPVQSTDRWAFKTMSGTQYILGRPHPCYMTWVRNSSNMFDLRLPFANPPVLTGSADAPDMSVWVGTEDEDLEWTRVNRPRFPEK